MVYNFFHDSSRSGRRCGLKYMVREIPHLVEEEVRARRIICLGVLLVVSVFLLTYMCHSSNSMSMTALIYLLVFDMGSIGVALLSVWVEKQLPNAAYTFGYKRFEVVAVFASTMLGVLGGFFMLKECVERLFESEDVVSTKYLVIGSLIVLGVHLLATYGVENPALNHVIDASSSSWLQEHVTDISESVCQWIPGLSKILLPRLHPISLLGLASVVVVLLVDLIIDSYGYHAVDAIGAIIMALMTFGTMMPMSVYSGRILLQTTPAHLLSQLDKAIREASTLDGVLELRKEHFWTLGFGQLVGTLQVRVRRDANEQMVLAHVTNRICNLVPRITIQVFKDDWTRSIGTFNFNWPPNQPPRVNPFLNDQIQNLPDLVPTAGPPSPDWTATS